MKYLLSKAETSVILPVFIRDSSKTDGSGLGSLDENSSIVGGYLKRNSTGVALAVDEDVATEGTYQAPSAAGKVRIGTPANMTTGTYELHFHNNLFTTADWVTITLGGASNMAPLLIEVQLTDIDLNTALASSTIGTCTTNTDMVGTAGANTTVPDAAGTAAGLHTTTDGLLGIIAGYIDTEVAAILAAIDTEIVDMKTIIDNLPNDGALSDIDAGVNNLETRLTVIRAGYLDELAAANIPKDVDTLLNRITAAVALASALTTAQNDLDKLTGTDGATLATTQANYAPAKAGDNMNLADDAITAATYDESTAFPISEKASKAAATIVLGTVDDTVAPTTTEFEADDITEATADHFNGRIVLWTSGALFGQATDITDYTLAGGKGHFTVTAMTEAPENNDEFVIL